MDPKVSKVGRGEPSGSHIKSAGWEWGKGVGKIFIVVSRITHMFPLGIPVDRYAVSSYKFHEATL